MQQRIIWVVALVLGLLVVWTGPFSGWLVRLDSVAGPHLDLPTSALGGPGFNSGLPHALVFYVLTQTLGSLAGWVFAYVIVVMSFVGAARLVPVNLAGRLAAGSFYALTPVMLDRSDVGQFGYLIGYSLLPWFVASLLRAVDGRGLDCLRPIIWWALMVGASVHFLWIGAVALVAVLVTRRPSVKILNWFLIQVVAVSLTSAYLWVAGTSQDSVGAVGAGDLDAFATQSGPDGIYLNLLTLYGFWREHGELPRDMVPVHWLFWSVIGLIIVFGFAVGLRRPGPTRGPLVVLLVTGVAGYLLAFGDQGPTGVLFRFAYDNLPGFSVMREPQKFIALWAMAASAAFAVGTSLLVEQGFREGAGNAARRYAVVLAAGVIAVPVVCTPNLLVGLGHSADAVEYPAAWAQANRTAGRGDGKVLMLPWHQYMSFPFADGRIIGSPGDALFERPVVSGDNTELPGVIDAPSGQSRYLTYLFDHGNTLKSFGAQVRPMGIEYIVVAKAIDYRKYDWLARQSDLELVMDTPELSLYRNERAAPQGYAAPTVDVADTAQAVDLIERQPDASAVMRVTGGATAAPTLPSSPSEPIESGPTSARLVEGRGANLPNLFTTGWRAGNLPAFETVQGTVGFEDVSSERAVNQRWTKLRAYYVVASLTFLVLVMIQVPHVRRLVRRLKRTMP